MDSPCRAILIVPEKTGMGTSPQTKIAHQVESSAPVLRPILACPGGNAACPAYALRDFVAACSDAVADVAAGGALPAVSFCGNGAIDLGEDCDLGR